MLDTTSVGSGVHSRPDRSLTSRVSEVPAAKLVWKYLFVVIRNNYSKLNPPSSYSRRNELINTESAAGIQVDDIMRGVQVLMNYQPSVGLIVMIAIAYSWFCILHNPNQLLPLFFNTAISFWYSLSFFRYS